MADVALLKRSVPPSIVRAAALGAVGAAPSAPSPVKSTMPWLMVRTAPGPVLLYVCVPPRNKVPAPVLVRPTVPPILAPVPPAALHDAPPATVSNPLPPRFNAP